MLTLRESRAKQVCLVTITLCCVATANLWATYHATTRHESVFVCLDPKISERQRKETRDFVEQQQREMKGGQFYKSLQLHVDFPSIDDPVTTSIDEVDLPDSTPVIGVEVDGKTCAYVVSRMVDPMAHIVTMTLNQTRVSVTYCDLKDCVRVLNMEGTSDSLHVGGLDIDNHLVLLMNGVRYGQMSAGIPLKDHPHVRTTLGDWRMQFPDSQVFSESIVR